MGKCWILEETGERRSPKRAEWFVVDGNIEEAQWDQRGDKFSILKLTEYQSNPREPIREAAERLRVGVWGGYTQGQLDDICRRAIQKYMAIIKDKS